MKTQPCISHVFGGKENFIINFIFASGVKNQPCISHLCGVGGKENYLFNLIFPNGMKNQPCISHLCGARRKENFIIKIQYSFFQVQWKITQLIVENAVCARHARWHQNAALSNSLFNYQLTQCWWIRAIRGLSGSGAIRCILVCVESGILLEFIRKKMIHEKKEIIYKKKKITYKGEAEPQQSLISRLKSCLEKKKNSGCWGEVRGLGKAQIPDCAGRARASAHNSRKPQQGGAAPSTDCFIC